MKADNVGLHSGDSLHCGGAGFSSGIELKQLFTSVTPFLLFRYLCLTYLEDDISQIFVCMQNKQMICSGIKLKQMFTVHILSLPWSDSAYILDFFGVSDVEEV